MIIAIDEALPFWKEAFSKAGEIRLFSGRDLKPADIRDVDALIVRTITPVTASLLERSRVRFVGAASAGFDHIDREYLKRNNIHFFYSAGCNANSVSEYVFTALHVIAARRNWELKHKSLAVIGAGNVGSRVAAKGRALGMEVRLCDPPLRDATGDPQYQSLDAVLGADILSFHVPLTSDGPYPTLRMLDKKMLARLSPEQLIVNSSRGPVIDGMELKAALRERRIAGAILDVWESEPAVDYALLELADIGTPHIAGTSLDGKIQATEMVREEFSRFFKLDIPEITAASRDRSVAPDPGAPGPTTALLSVLLEICDIIKADADLRALKSLPSHQSEAGFDRLRKDFPLRPEFRHFIVNLDEMHIDLAGQFKALGFKTRTV